ncbi:MAG: TylF/MycF/NovP-related O-methyltransferase [Frankiaceae bacterium]
MTWRRTVNSALERTVGYRLVKAPARIGASTPARKATPPARPASVAPSAPVITFPADYDDEARAIITAVKPWTMTSPERLHALILATRYVSRHHIPGAIVECGVWRGGSMQAAARTLISCNDTERHLYLFDTFQGMPPPAEKDRRRDGELAATLLERAPRQAGIWAVASKEDVQAGFDDVPYPPDKVHLIPGLVEETVPAQAPDQIAVLRLDTDWYASTKHELTTLYPRLSPGGVLLIDDYGWWLGSRQAVDEYLAETGARLLLLRMDEGRIAIKP